MKKINILIILACTLFSQIKAQTYNYAEALQKSLYFYDAEKSGPGITGGRLPWRGNSEVSDQKLPLNTTMTDMSQTFINANKAIFDPENKGYVDVSGGFHDAGDHVKFGLPQSYSSSTLEWTLYEFRDAFVQIGELAHMKEILKWFSDYYLRCTFMNSSGQVVAFCYQVGEGNSDHTLWAPPEIIDRTVITRPGYFATSEKPASDQCAGAAASLALTYLNNKTDDATYANKCLSTAKALYTYATQYRGLGYSGGFYNSSFDEDELSWAAVWLYIATNDSKYLTDIISKDANGMYNGWLSRIIHSSTDDWQNIWVHSWDTKWGGVFAKLAPIVNNDFYWYIFRWNLEYWAGVPHANANDGSFLKKTPAGFSFLNSWGSARYNAAAQLQALVYKKATGLTTFDSWIISQMQYIMGNNPLKRSYIVGYGSEFAKHPHHRAAHGSPSNSMFDPPEHKHILYGALVGGPGANDEHVDETKDFVYNEVAIDYNAGLVGALAGLYAYFGQGQSPIANFYPTDPPLTEFSLSAKIEQENNERSQISIQINNEAAYPPRLDVSIKARYYFNISELFAYNQSISDISTAVYYDESSVKGAPVTVSGPLAFDAASGIYYMEFQWPLGFYGKRELQFALIAKQENVTYKAHWDPTNDYSHQGLTNAYAATNFIPMYVDGTLKIGKEPTSNIVSVTGVTVSPASTSVDLGNTVALTATILPSDATNKAVTWTSSNTAVATVNSTGVVTGVSNGTATITVTTQDGNKTATCTVAVTGTSVAVTGVTLNPTTISIGISGTTTLTATVLPSNATNKNVTWSSSNPTAATVSSAGVVTGISAGTATITVTTQDGNKTATCAITVTNAVSCLYGTPIATALPTINKSFSYIYVLGTGGPSLSNVSNLTINWNLPDKGFYQFSMNTKDGTPNWYVDLRTGSTQTFASVQPAITLSGTGFTGLDGSYWATIDNGNFVLVSKTGNFTIYFSNSATAPVCTKSASPLVNDKEHIMLYPNPFTTEVTMTNTNKNISSIEVYNQLGTLIVRIDKQLLENDMVKFGSNLPKGIYMVKVHQNNMSKVFKLIKR